MKCHCEQSEAGSILESKRNRDCFSTERLAMIVFSNISDVSTFIIKSLENNKVFEFKYKNDKDNN